MKKYVFTSIALMLIACVEVDNESELPKEVPLANHEVLEVTVDEAMSVLSEFMIHSGLSMTKSGEEREILSFHTYFTGGVDTKSSTDVTYPNAYVVNFANDEGFAVLGANTGVAPIVAVVDRGNINPETLEITDKLLENGDVDINESFNWTTFDWYCEEDEDYYVMADQRFVTNIIRGAIDLQGNIYYAPPVTGETVIQTIEPLIKQEWGQGYWDTLGAFNKYCRKNNGKYAFAGCSTAALAMIMVSNEAPQNYWVNEEKIHWESIKASDNVMLLDSLAQEHVSLLYGSIFNNVTHLSTSQGTLITPRQIELLMKNELKFKNVIRHSDSEFTESMQRITETHLRDQKPVFISAIHNGNFFKGHSWVIDGMDMDSMGNRLFHFNFGWSGTCNGYFSLSCFNPVQAVSYDTESSRNTDEYYDTDYNNHFRLISYDLPDLLDVTLDF